MKSTPPAVRRFSLPLSLVLAAVLFPADAAEWKAPSELIGSWSSTQLVTVRLKDAKGDFVFVKETVPIRIVIDAAGRVEGEAGGAKFTGCTVRENRGSIGRFLNLKSDYIIKGSLAGNLFEKDSIAEKEISGPFNIKEASLTGTLFQKQGRTSFRWFS